MSTVVVVESPSKIKAIKSYLGSGYRVLASFGHVRDLDVKATMPVDPDDGFKMKFIYSDRGKQCMTEIKEAMKDADKLVLATDPDREGEAIAWHVFKSLEEENHLNSVEVERVTFGSITKNEVLASMAAPRGIDNGLVASQQARRCLDYFVGFNVSPVLWAQVASGLSAGRVQSPALRLVVEREQTIINFKPETYWAFKATWSKEKTDVVASLLEMQGEKVKKMSVIEKTVRDEWKGMLTAEVAGGFTIKSIEAKESHRKPQAPFSTSSLQQDANVKLKWDTKKTMQVAQKLYEGIDIGYGQQGLITYMRTDSTDIAEDAATEIRNYIVKTYGEDRIPEKIRSFANKKDRAEEAHEAIRVTFPTYVPDAIKKALDADQFALYELIWRRTIACQMTDKISDVLTVQLSTENSLWQSTAQTVKDEGYSALFSEIIDEEGKDKNTVQDKVVENLPPVEEGEVVTCEKLDVKESKTHAPPRYTEASLIKELDKYGIGRPSTWATIMTVIKTRKYVKVQKRLFVPTELGIEMIEFLKEHFSEYVDYAYTSGLETELDKVAMSEMSREEMLDSFWGPFAEKVAEKKKMPSKIGPRDVGTTDEGEIVRANSGPHGDYVTLGERDTDAFKIKSLNGISKKDVTLEQALELFKWPRVLGDEGDYTNVCVKQGKDGGYFIAATKTDDPSKPKYASLPLDLGPDEITLELAIELVVARQEEFERSVLKTFTDEGNDKYSIREGKYGPYITDGKVYASVPKDMQDDIESITLEQAGIWIKEKKASSASKKKTSKKKTSKKKALSKKKTVSETYD